MNYLPGFALAVALAAGGAQAENLTQQNTDRAKAVIDAAVEAHGGDRLMNELETLAVEFTSVNHAVGQSRGTAPPWDRNEARGRTAIAPERSVFVAENEGAGGGFEFSNVTIVNGENSVQINRRAGTVAQVAEPDFDTTSGPFVRVTPALLVRSLKAREANAYYLGETREAERTYDVIGFSMAVGPAISLYFDRQTALLRQSERLLPGVGLVQYAFDDYESVDGIPFNRKFTLYLNGDVTLERDIVSVTVNEPIDDLLAVDERLVSVPAVQPDPVSRQEIADGVWLIGGNGTYAMFVDMGDHVFAAGGTAGIPERIERLREVVGDKPIRYGLITHHHFDHVLGVPAYQAEGATVIAAEAHERVAREAALDGVQLDLELIDERMTIESDEQRVDIMDIGPTAHTEHLLVAYLPEEGILFEADHFALPQAGPVPPAVSATRTFAEALARLELPVEKIASAHSARVATRADLEAALEADAVRASR
jgi:glyoxylase-like metal-dependent hydrolase (beta-lactamase superfamily II)